MSDKKSEATEAFLASLTSRAQDAVNTLTAGPLHVTSPSVDDNTDEEVSGRLFLHGLTGAAKAAITQLTNTKLPEPEPPSTKVKAPAPQYGLVEVVDGEWPTLTMSPTVAGMVNRIQALEGKDVVVWPFYGIPLALSEGPQRYVVLPNGTAVSVPLFDGGPSHTVPATKLQGISIESSGYLGPVELRPAMPAPQGMLVATEED